MPVVEGATVRLRPLERSEWPKVYGWFRDPEVVAPFDRYFAETFEGFARSLAEPAPPESLAPRFAVEPLRADGVVGVVGHYVPHPVLESVEVWYIIGERAARGHGYGREAVGLLVEYLWSTTSVERIGITCDVDNVASVRLAEGLGFRKEGTLRSAFFHHARWHDVYLYGLTRGERSPPASRG